MLIEIVFRGFGRLMPKMRKARTAFKPHTREAISVPAKIVVKFKPYGELASLPQE
ncbi:MAG: HU family DNA-binding protein, partial [Chloroflexi bacterium]|nr:HU family DNA-binding protein [Chloroflexota bacterium]